MSEVGMRDIADEIVALYRQKGEMSYGEGVSMNAHGLQAALLAEQEEAGNALIVAALLHDIGHLLHDLPEDIADRGVDTEHESIASAWLSQYFPPAVSEPVRLHVAAKRYLCATEPEYFGELSQASVQSLQLQAGPCRRRRWRISPPNPSPKRPCGYAAGTTSPSAPTSPPPISPITAPSSKPR